MSASLVIQTAFIGDMVLTTPLIAVLARQGPVDVVGTPANVSLLANSPHVRRLMAYDKRGPRPIWNLVTIGRQLRAGGRYDAAYLAQGSMRSAALAIIAGVRRRIGFDTSGGRHLYTVRVRYEEDAHHAERLLQLAAARGVPTTGDLRPRLYPGETERTRVDELLRRRGLGDRPLIALAPGSVWPTKQWPYYPELAARLSGVADVVVIGSAADRELATAILARVPSGLDTTGRLSLLEAAELIGRCTAAVSNDSAPVHLASAMNTPTLTIFGPTVPEFGYGPLSKRNELAGHESLACRPCDRHGPRRCPLGHWRCMRELSADAVHESLLRLVPELS